MSSASTTDADRAHERVSLRARVGALWGAPRFVTQNRARHAVLNQMLLCAIVLVVIGLQMMTGMPVAEIPLLIGILLIYAGGVAALVVPWARLAPQWVMALPLADIVAIGLMRVSDPASGVALLWAFPAMWLSSLGLGGLIVASVLISGFYVAIQAFSQGPASLAVFLLPLVIVFIGITTYNSSRRFGAQRLLLDRQASALSGALQRAQRQETIVTEVLDAVDFGVIRISREGTVGVVNEALGRFQQQIPGFGSFEDDPHDVFLADGTTPLPAEDRPLLRALDGETFDNLILWYGAPEARRYAVSLSARRVRDHENHDGGSVIIVRDVTAEMTALRARDRLVSSVSHELRTPLTSILGYVDLAIDTLDDPVSAEKHLQVAQRNGERLLEIVSDILAASSSSRLSVDMTISPQSVRMGALVRTAAESQAPRAAERSVTLDLSGVEDVPAYVDPQRIRQVVDNLLSNAIKFNRDGGSVVVGVTTDDDTTWLLVRDSGIGIRPEDQERLFERFYRARTGVDGTGLGLSIARDIVRAHNGEITLRSTPGAGSTFVVRLPAREGARIAEPPTALLEDRTEGRADRDA